MNSLCAFVSVLIAVVMQARLYDLTQEGGYVDTKKKSEKT